MRGRCPAPGELAARQHAFVLKSRSLLLGGNLTAPTLAPAAWRACSSPAAPIPCHASFLEFSAAALAGASSLLSLQYPATNQSRRRECSPSPPRPTHITDEPSTSDRMPCGGTGTRCSISLTTTTGLQPPAWALVCHVCVWRRNAMCVYFAGMPCVCLALACHMLVPGACLPAFATPPPLAPCRTRAGAKGV